MIEFRHLKYFLAVAEESSFRRAAERLPMDVSALSRSIRELEDDVGVPLFVRSTVGTRITPAGQRMLEGARGVFAALTQTIQGARLADSGEQLPLRIGIADGLSQPILSLCLSSWRKSVPEIELELSELSAIALAQALRRETVDVGFSFGLFSVDGIVQESVWSDSLVALLPVDHPLAGIPALRGVELVGMPLVMYDPERQPGAYHQVNDLILKYAGSQPLKIAAMAASFGSSVTKVGAGFGVGLADAGHVQDRPDIVPVRIDEADAKLHTHLMWRIPREDAGLPSVIQRFIDHVKQVTAENLHLLQLKLLALVTLALDWVDQTCEACAMLAGKLSFIA